MTERAPEPSATDQKEVQRAVSMRVLLVAAVSLLISLVVGAFAVSTGRQVSEVYRHAATDARELATATLRKLAVTVASNTADSLRSAVLDNNYGYVAQVVTSLVGRDETIRYVACLDAKHIPIEEGGDKGLAVRVLPRAKNAFTTSNGGAFQVTDVESLLVVGAPVMEQKTRVGSIVIAYDTKPIDASLAEAAASHAKESSRAMRRLIVTGGIVLLIGIAIAGAVGLWLTRPVDRVAQAASILAAGRFDVRARATGPREVRQLAHVFNSMAARLDKSMQASIERAALEHELDLARQLQLSMMPPEGQVEIGNFELCSWYLPAGACGGDWWSYVAQDRDRLILLIGDVMGHGLPAAFLTASARSAYETALHLEDAHTPLQLLEHIDWGIRHGDRTMSCFVSIVDLRTGEMAMGSGGHPAPLRVRPNGDRNGEVGALTVVGTLLGDTRKMFGTEVVTLAAGDVVVWFTDGITEAMNPEGRMFGIRRLMRGLAQTPSAPLADLMAALRADFYSFIKEVEIDDDITVVLGRYKGHTTASPRRSNLE